MADAFGWHGDRLCTEDWGKCKEILREAPNTFLGSFDSALLLLVRKRRNQSNQK